MSDMSSAASKQFEDAARVPVWTRPSAGGFTARGASDTGGFSAWAQSDSGQSDHGFYANASNDVADAEALIAQGYADGLNEGRRLAMIEMEEERAALHRLAAGIECLNPQGSDGLAAMLANSVKRLVTQIVGEVEINADTLAERTQAVAAMIAEETAPSRLRLHPTDVIRLQGANISVEMVGDPMLAPGTIVLDTGTGWVEDGPHVRLEKLRAQLDRLGAPK
jgi:flagellar assembly protein FliH